MWNPRNALLIVVAVFCATFTAAARGQDNLLIAPRVDAAPTIDGRLDDACWQTAGRATDFYRMSEATRADEKTVVYLAHDDANLYYAADVTDDAVAARQRQRDAGTWEDDCVELFIDTARQRRDEFQFIFTAANAIFDANLGDASWTASPDVTFVAAPTKTGWAVEVAIPFETLGVETPHRGDVWDIKLSREDYSELGGTPRLSSWTQVGKTFHDAGAFGRLAFVDLNRASNGDFTGGVMEGRWCGGEWRLSKNSQGGQITIDPSGGRDGSACGSVVLENYTQLQTCVRVQPRRNYRLGVWINRDDLSPTAGLEFYTDKDNKVSASKKAEGWQYLETFVTAGDSPYIVMTWTAYHGNGSYLIDDLRVEEIDNTPRDDASICYTGNATGVLAKHNQRVTGRYTYYDHASRAAFFPQAEQRGSADVERHDGWIAFDAGKLTDADASYIQFAHWTVSPGKTIVFDLGEDRYVTDVELEPVERRLRNLRVYLKAADDKFFTLAATPEVRPGDVAVKGLDAHARWVRIDYNGECGWREARIWGAQRDSFIPPRPVKSPQITTGSGGPALADAPFAIFPTPKDAVYGEGRYTLGDTIYIEAPAELRDSVDLFAEELAARTGASVEVGGGSDIRISLDPSIAGDEAYTLAIDGGGARIAVSTARGAIYGMHSLLQCVTGRALRHVVVRDAPTYAYRAFQIWSRMFSDDLVDASVPVFARIKMNELILMSGTPYDVPRVNRYAAMGLDTTVAAVTMPAAGWFRSVIELNPGETVEDLPSLDRVNPCPSNPKTWELIDKEIERAGLFPGKYAYINCDEMYQSHKGARWNVCELCQARNMSGGDLFADMINRIHEKFAAIGKTPVMLDTMYCVPWKMAGAFEKIPRDIPIIIWHPQVQDGLTDLGYNIGEFFDGDGWSIDPAKPNVIGGYVPGDGGMKLEKTALFAEALWSGQYPDVSDPITLRRLADVMASVHEARIGAPLPSRNADASRFTPIDLPGNCDLADGATLLDAGEALDLSFMAGDIALNDVPTRIGSDIAVLENRGALDARYDTQVRIPVDRKAASLVFLHALTRPLVWTYSAQSTIAGSYFIEYEDGSRVWMPIRYKYNILEHDALGGTTASYKSKLITLPEAVPAYRGTMPDGNPILLCQAEWVNPRPEKKVAAVVMASSSRMHGSRVALFALSAVAPTGNEASRDVTLLPAADHPTAMDDTHVDLAGGTYESETRYRAPDGTTIEASDVYYIPGATLIAVMKAGLVTVNNNLGWQVHDHNPQTLTVTFPQPRAVSGVVLRGMPESPEYVFTNRLGPTAHRVEVTTGGDTWREVAAHDDYIPDRDGALRHRWPVESIKAIRITSMRADRDSPTVRGFAHLAILTP